MKKGLQEVITSFWESINGSIYLPYWRYLLEVNDNTKEVYKEKSDTFHSLTAKLILLKKISRPEIEKIVSYLRKGASNSDE